MRFVMSPTPRTRVRSSQQLTRGSNFSASRDNWCGLCWPLVSQGLHWRQKSHEGLYHVIPMRSSSSCPCRSCEGSIVGVLYWSPQEICKQTEILNPDNTKNFKNCNKRISSCLVRFWRQKNATIMAGHRIRWQFIVERAPWWGWFYVRDWLVL